VKKALSTLPGVADVTVDFGNKIAHCQTNPDEFSTDKAIEALAGAGFEATVLDDEE
jgi:copper chaperone CopZ